MLLTQQMIQLNRLTKPIRGQLKSQHKHIKELEMMHV